MLLDLQAAQVVARAHVFERAVNDPGPWSIRIGATEVAVIRVRTTRGVVFLAHFDEGAQPDEHTAWLVCNGKEISSKDVVPCTDAFGLEWRFGLPERSEETLNA